MEPPLTLIINQISPPTLIPSYIPSSNPSSSSSSQPSSSAPAILLPPPPTSFVFSPTPNYPSPFGTVSLGSTLALDLSLENTSDARNDVLGVKMMVECQGPAGRFRLGEVIHRDSASKPESKSKSISSSKMEDEKESESPFIEDKDQDQEQDIDADEADDSQGETLPVLKHGEKVNIQIENEIKDLGMNILIVSVAWETLEGRKTFQRFLKFNVNPPLSIKTRIQTPSSPNTLLSPSQREKVYLEILLQNISPEYMSINDIFLEPVQGLKSLSLNDVEEGKIVLLPEDIRQFLFVLTPSPSPDTTNEKSDDGIRRSSFPPTYPGGTILPLGRLDITWKSGQYGLPGRLQTSTLNRRVPLPPSPSPALPPKGGILPHRTLSAQSGVGVPGSPLAQTRDRLNNTLLAPSPIKGTLPQLPPHPHEKGEEWEFDFTLAEDQREFDVEQRFKLPFRLAMRSTRTYHTSNAVQGGSRTGEQNEEDDDDDDDQPLSRISSRVSQSQSQTHSQSHPQPQSQNQTQPPKLPKIAVQYLTPLPIPSTHLQTAPKGIQPQQPQLNILSPSRSGTPMSPTPSNADRRALSPEISRGGTPISSQLRLAQAQGLTSMTSLSGTSATNATNANDASSRYRDIPVSSNADDALVLEEEGETFPPSPFIISNTATYGLINLGNSLTFLDPSGSGSGGREEGFEKVVENSHPTYSEGVENSGSSKGKYRWEIEYKFELEFIAFDEGSFGLGGLRVIEFDDFPNEEGKGGGGRVLREWNSLGDLSVVGL
ncbi:uncharacterized protein I303_104253 [Kwoniella dejecticola CBS 10117]|uniref:DUF974 domain-containing protein n=1 Tax=Kwoniella dejecticola CBS 10117 TaxID=1296121 RepID=A0A1A6A5V1_9TREE|nr:uncharacterized protein I303_04770 [Kwoniella dejecticola CBS 10117]OBR85435.1 hypothetical protein I303_04770 [Kwoniella dejecticola CBS 10117]